VGKLSGRPGPDPTPKFIVRMGEAGAKPGQWVTDRRLPDEVAGQARTHPSREARLQSIDGTRLCACGLPHPKCRSHTKAGTPCMATPREGAYVCRKHGGNAPQVLAAAKRRLQAAEAFGEATALGIAVETTPVESLEAMLWESAGAVCYLRDRVASLGAEITVDEFGPGGAHKFTAHPLVMLYNSERDRHAALAAVCIKLGLDERRVRLAEEQGDRIFGGFTRACQAANLTSEQVETMRRAFAAELRPKGELAA
jgi:hypothetical protein